MQDDPELPFTFEYEQALSQFMAQPDESTLQRARALGGMAKSLGIRSHAVVVTHAKAPRACAPQMGLKEFTTATEFLTESLLAFESESAMQREHSLRRAAHELRTPLTTLRLALQVGLGHLEKGGSIEPVMLQKALAQVDKLTAKVADLLGSQDAPSTSALSNSP